MVVMLSTITALELFIQPMLLMKHRIAFIRGLCHHVVEVNQGTNEIEFGEAVPVLEMTLMKWFSCISRVIRADMGISSVVKMMRSDDLSEGGGPTKLGDFVFSQVGEAGRGLNERDRALVVRRHRRGIMCS